MKKAAYWTKAESGSIKCELCPNYCLIRQGNSGSCGVRTNRDGVLYADGYGKVSSSQVDPIEKKPLYHFRPGTDIFSIGGWGCNLHCSFCQNWSISQEFREGSESFSPDQVVSAAERSGTDSIAYTYNEPFISMEFVRECSDLARRRGMKNVAVTNGYVSTEALADAIEAIDAFNVDVKSMEDGFYKRNCGGKLQSVLEFCKAVRACGKHLEITNLVIPGENDSDELLLALVDWIAEELGEDVPLHFSAYRPQYKMSNPSTDPAILNRAHELASGKLNYVYLGNVISDVGQNTVCRKCGSCLISRSGYATVIAGIKDGACTACGSEATGFCW